MPSVLILNCLTMLDDL